MSIPLVQTYRIARYILEQKLKGNKRYPLVLMLEPLFQCNLACSGCGKIDYPDEILRKRVVRRGRAEAPSTSAARRSCRSPAASR